MHIYKLLWLLSLLLLLLLFLLLLWLFNSFINTSIIWCTQYIFTKALDILWIQQFLFLIPVTMINPRPNTHPMKRVLIGESSSTVHTHTHIHTHRHTDTHTYTHTHKKNPPKKQTKQQNNNRNLCYLEMNKCGFIMRWEWKSRVYRGRWMPRTELVMLVWLTNSELLEFQITCTGCSVGLRYSTHTSTQS